MLVQHISDTHGNHDQIEIVKCDLLIHSGDATNYYDFVNNQVEFEKFLEWWKAIDVEHKIFVPGNHDAFATLGFNLTELKKYCTVLMHQETTIAGLNIFGSPYTPKFGNWHFMKARDRINRLWEQIPENLDIFICHGPPKRILDLTYDKEGTLEHCGDGALLKALINKKPKNVLFGHLHDNNDNLNFGIFERHGIKFVNSAVVHDNKMGVVQHRQGNILEICKK